MKRLVALFAVSLALVASNCTLDTEGTALFEQTGGSPDASVGGAGTGGAGKGGSTSQGGNAGKGGAISAGSGGVAGSGGASGNSGTGGIGEGGSSGAGGSGDGGSPGTGGSGEGGSSGTGGSTGTGGSGEGGSSGTGGSTGTGGSGEGGSTGTGGTTGTGGSGTGGNTGTGGTTGNDAAVCALTTLPAPTGFPHETHVTNVRINGGSAVANDIAPGSQVTVVYDFQIINSDPCYCPGCWQQVYVGLAGLPTDHCSNQQRGCPGNSGTNKSVTFTAPAQPGTYYLSVESTWEWDCISVTPTADPALYVGAICVK